ncbi:MAG: hypothetical protein JRC53_01090 [Deltaproteobacteria bacterium]|nr:hypothetical protein [Deltaproteobacteria bacterium]
MKCPGCKQDMVMVDGKEICLLCSSGIRFDSPGVEGVKRDPEIGDKPKYYVYFKCDCGREFKLIADPNWGFLFQGLAQVLCRACNRVHTRLNFPAQLMKEPR